MKKFGLNELREMYLSFFESKGHLRLNSFSLIPQNDASLLLINSGMAPMKPFFTGEQEPPRHRVTTCQKCIRTGDIENIGKTARHGTYFEMLGNFSFGDYFKKEAIPFAWEFLTSPEWVGIDPDRLYPSVFAGNETTPADDEAFEIWNKVIGIPEERIFRFGKEDNFWEHGSGPCGPCTEIYYDRGEKYGCGKPGCTVGCDCDRYMEVWNVVFSQFDNDGNNNYTELAQKNIDTGMGLERLAVVCQDVDSLFDVDTVMNITNRVTELTGASYGQSYKMDVSLRIITDHIRASVMMICDGVLPSNEGRGYVLRRLLRRAARHGKLLGVEGGFLYKVVPTVVQENAGAYPDLVAREAYITKVIRVEEENFAKTIDAGLRIYNGMLEEHKAKGETVFSGADAFKLYDTYGFPIDLTIEMAEDEGMTVDEAGFRELMEEQRVRARKAREALGDLAWAGIDLGLDGTPTTFTGYDGSLTADGKILAIVTDGELCSSIREGEEGIIVLDQTPFYAEMGGQSTDQGVMTMGESCFKVTNVQKDKADKYLHYGKMVKGRLAVDDTVTGTVDKERRDAISRAHSATHLLQAALQKVLGDHVHQAGSLNTPDHIRFDFTHFSAITDDELRQVTEFVNDAILEGYDINTRVMGIEDAKKEGAMALFGEKYGEEVRVVSMGDVSKEFCGGTHLTNTAKIGAFCIISEGSVASGVRRIEAVVGKENLKLAVENTRLLRRAANALKTTPSEVYTKMEQVIREGKELRQQMDQLQSKLLANDAERFLYAAKNVEGLNVITTTLSSMSAGALRKIGDMLRDKDDTVVAVLSSVSDEKITFHAVCGKKAVAAGIKAGDLIRTVTSITGGSGGGKPDSAMGGGKDPLMLDNALAVVDNFVSEHVKK
ncbi:MAG: alanine--tRNA ligase [Oscillospiraceae bacterium]|nr:alanine--tRNA ligase [Oscillospiraceae bacterium]